MHHSPIPDEVFAGSVMTVTGAVEEAGWVEGVVSSVKSLLLAEPGAGELNRSWAEVGDIMGSKKA